MYNIKYKSTKFLFICLIFFLGCNNNNIKITASSSAPNQTTPPIQQDPSIRVPKHCADLNQTNCPNSKNLINEICEWKNDKCIPKVNGAGEISTLEQFLKTSSIAPEVSALAQIGINNYKKSSFVQDRNNARNANSNGGGRSRTGDWINDAFGRSEAELIKELKSIDGPKTWSLAEIDKAYDEATKKNPRDESLPVPIFTLVKGLGVNYLNEYPLGQNAIVQLASQFNYLEAPSSDKVSVSAYLSDGTQGPQGSIEAAAAALHRTAAESTGKLPHSFQQIFTSDTSDFYKNGYLELFRLSDAKLTEFHTLIKTNIKKLTILPQWVLCEVSGKKQLQVFSAAPSYQNALVKPPLAGSKDAELCDELVSAQYEAIAKMAVIRSISTGERVPVHFTLVGQGVFNNPPSVIATSLKKAAQVAKGYPLVNIYVHGYSSSDQNQIRAALDPAFFSLKEITKEEFKLLK